MKQWHVGAVECLGRSAWAAVAWLVIAGCDRTLPAVTQPEATINQGETAEAPAVAATSPRESAVAPELAAPAKPVAPPPAPAAPRTHSELLAAVDFAKFPKIEGATRQSSNALNAAFTIPKKSAADVQRAVAALTAFLAAEGWQPAPGAPPAPWGDTGGLVFYQKAGVMLEATAGVSRGYPPGSEDLNAGVFLIGEVDSRSLPRPPGSTAQRESFSSSEYTCPLPLMEVRRFFKERLPALGWTEYRDYTEALYQKDVEKLALSQSFVRNGAKLYHRLEEKNGSTTVAVNCGMLERFLPILPVKDVIKLRDTPPLIVCDVRMTVAEVFDWYQTELGKTGWTGKAAPPVEARTVRFEFQKPGAAKPLFLDCLEAGKSTIVSLGEK